MRRGRGQRRTGRTGERARAHGSKQAEDRGLLSEWMHIFKDSSPPPPPVPRVMLFKTLVWKLPFQEIFLMCRAQRQKSKQDTQGPKAPIGQG